MNEDKGFSLIELLIVMAIIGLMSATVLANLTQSTRMSRDAKRKTDIGDLRKAISLYFDDHGTYPPNSDDDDNGWDDSTDGIFIQPLVDENYLKEPILDPRNTGSYKYSYQYYNPSQTSCIGDIAVFGVRLFEADDPMDTYAQCPSGEDWEPLFDYVIMEGE